MTLQRVYETILYAHDLGAIADFYRGVLGLRQIREPIPLAVAFRLPDDGVLLIFDERESSKPAREVPSHGARGEGHIAFSMEEGTYDSWKQRLLEAGVSIEQEMTWPPGGRSIYLRDPAHNSVELVEGEIWEMSRKK